MLQLSDKELDQLSQKAAEQYDPGLEHSPGSWEKLEYQLTKDLGRSHPSLFRGYRRIPFLYTPIVVLLVGVSYFVFKQGARQKPSASRQTDTASLAGPANSSPPGAVIRAMPSAATPPSADDHTPKNDLSPKIEIPGNNSTTENATANARAKKGATGKGPHMNGIPSRDEPHSLGNIARTRENTLSGKAGPAGKSSPAANAPYSGIKDLTGRKPGSGSGNRAANNPGSGNNTRAGANSGPGIEAGAGNQSYAGNTVYPERNITRSLRSKQNSRSRNKHKQNGRSNDKSPRDTFVEQAESQDGNPGNSTKPGLAEENQVAGNPYSRIRPSLPSSHPRPFIYDSALNVMAANMAANQAAAKKALAESAKKNGHSLQIRNPLQIGLLYGPDFTTVKSFGGDKPGHSLGVTLGYSVFKGLSVNTGLLWTRKNYTAPASDFHLPPGSWFNNNNLVQLHYVQGSMDLMEIPLNLRYDFKLPDNSIVYVSTGLSSYLEGNENCLYFYENFGMNRRAPEKQDDHDSYWFSSLNLSFGIEKPISKTFSLQMEPYLKIPLNGVGIGNVQMNSFGLYFSLKYSPVLSRSRH
ncbi:MAG: outer membrane beta-barrel protein [Puia sp.]|nr:outer membrane beta-barrel protein [Puia sp.]